MPRALVLFTFGGFALACAQPLGCAQPVAPATPVSPARAHAAQHAPVASARPEPASALASGCRAQPSTVYGDEPVVFEIQGPSSTAPVALELRDERGQAVLQGRAPLPGQWRPAIPGLKSGDFRLAVLGSGVSCMVTVNRELSRATELAR